MLFISEQLLKAPVLLHPGRYSQRFSTFVIKIIGVKLSEMRYNHFKVNHGELGMAQENGGQSVRDYGNRKKRVKRIRNVIIITLVLIIAVGASVYLYYLYNKSYKSFETISSVDNAAGGAARYFSYGSAVVKYTKDGATAINKDGKLIWNGSYEMNNPVTDTCGDYVVVADKGGTSVEIFDGKGTAGSISVPYDIIKAEVASQGVVAVLMENKNANYIYLYDVDGSGLVEMKTNVPEDGYPLDMSLSNDGKKLIANYLTVTGGKLASTATFYNFGEVGQNGVDKIVGFNKYEDIVAPRVIFNNNNTACLFKDNALMIFSYSEKPSVIAEENFESKIRSIFYSDSYVGVVLEQGAQGYNQLIVYRLDGRKVLDKKLDYDFTNIYMSGEEIIMNDNTSCVVLKLNGSVKFSQTFDSNIAAIYPINQLDKYFLINEDKISQISLVE